MVERLLLDGIDAEPRRTSVGREDHRVAVALPDEAGAALALVQPAVARTEIALDAAVVEAVPPATRMMAHARILCVANSSSLHFETVYRATRIPGLRVRPLSPAFSFSAAMNVRGSGSVSHTCGRNVARWWPA